MDKYNLRTLDFEPHLYTRVKTEEQEEKEAYYSEEGLQREDYLDMVNPDELTPRDVRQLVRAEDELSQCKLYTRIFPSKDSNQFLQFLTPPSYSDYLLDAWEAKYSDNREAGRQLLKEKCSQNVHLDK